MWAFKMAAGRANGAYGIHFFFLRFGRRLVCIKHDGQVPTCRKCHQPGHVARLCTNVSCFNCDQLGPTFRDCPDILKCGISKEDGHYAVDCELSWWRRPVSAANDDNGDDEKRPSPENSPPSENPPPPDDPPADVPPSASVVVPQLPPQPQSVPSSSASQPSSAPLQPSCLLLMLCP